MLTQAQSLIELRRRQYNEDRPLRSMKHPVMEDYICSGGPAVLSETPTRLLRLIPCLDKHTRFVIPGFLNIAGQELFELLSDPHRSPGHR